MLSTYAIVNANHERSVKVKKGNLSQFGVQDVCKQRLARGQRIRSTKIKRPDTYDKRINSRVDLGYFYRAY